MKNSTISIVTSVDFNYFSKLILNPIKGQKYGQEFRFVFIIQTQVQQENPERLQTKRCDTTRSPNI